MTIPIRNIFYMLLYAWNKVNLKDELEINWDGITNLLDLYAKILVKSVQVLIQKGIYKSYVSNLEEIGGVKGKIVFPPTIKRNLLKKQRTVCEYDEFSENIIANKIIYSTILTLLDNNACGKELKKDLHRLKDKFIEVERIKITEKSFEQIRLNRNNEFYGISLTICRLINQSLVPLKFNGGKNHFKFVNLLDDETKMSFIYEEFLRNFYMIHFKDKYKVSRQNIEWQFELSNESNDSLIPKMQTDISLDNEERKIIIDAKYYSKSVASNQYGNEKFHSHNLYQLFAYLLNQEEESAPITMSTTGILLYPKVEKDYDFLCSYKNHKIIIKTIDLMLPWEEIQESLFEIVEKV